MGSQLLMNSSFKILSIILQTHLIEQYLDDLKQNFADLYQILFEHTSFTQRQDFCANFAASNPELIFRSNDFHSLKEPLYFLP